VQTPGRRRRQNPGPGGRGPLQALTERDHHLAEADHTIRLDVVEPGGRKELNALPRPRSFSSALPIAVVNVSSTNVLSYKYFHTLFVVSLK